MACARKDRNIHSSAFDFTISGQEKLTSQRSVAADESRWVLCHAAVVDGLNLVLADSYALMALTHLAHWNVEGADFFPRHKIFQEQYENLFEAVDVIAERVRARDAYAIGGLGVLAKAAEMEEFSSPLPQKDYVAALIVAHEKVVNDAVRTRN